MWKDMDDAFVALGTFGKWHVQMFFGTCTIATASIIWHMFSHVFIAAFPSYRCRFPFEENFTDNSEQSLKRYLPYECTEDMSYCELSGCYMFANVTSVRHPDDGQSFENETAVIACDRGYVYGDEFAATIVTEWDLVCDDAVKEGIVYAVLGAGFVVGALVFTTLSDYFGRKKILLLVQALMCIVGIVQAFMPEFYSFTILGFIRGTLMQGTFLVAVVYISEMFSSKQRAMTSVGAQIMLSIWMMLLAGIAALITHYRYLMLTICSPILIIPLLIWGLPESVPWLISQRRVADAEAILRNACKTNRKVIPDHIWESLRNVEMDKKEIQDARQRDARGEDGPGDMNVCTVCKTSKTCVYLAAVLIYWLFSPGVYYGITLNIGNLAGNMYLNFFLLGLTELPSAFVMLFLLPIFGRKKSLLALHLLTVLALAGATIHRAIMGTEAILAVELACILVAKFGSTSAFLVSTFYTPEIFPTPIRNTVAGLAGLVGTLVNMIVPFINLLGSTPGLEYLPMFVYTIFMTLGGIAVAFLPETVGRALPQTIDDVLAWDDGYCKCGKLPQKQDVPDEAPIEFYETDIQPTVNGSKPASNPPPSGHDNKAFQTKL